MPDEIPTQTESEPVKPPKPRKPRPKKETPTPKVLIVGKGRAAISHLMPEIYQQIILPRLMHCLQYGVSDFKGLAQVYAQCFNVRLSETVLRNWCRDCGIQFQMRMQVTVPPTMQTKPLFQPLKPQAPTHFQTDSISPNSGGQYISPSYAKLGAVNPLEGAGKRLSPLFAPFPQDGGGFSIPPGTTDTPQPFAPTT